MAIQKCDQATLKDSINDIGQAIRLDHGQRLLIAGGLITTADALNAAHAASEANDVYLRGSRLLEGGAWSRSHVVRPEGLKAVGRGFAVASVAWDTHNMAAGLGEGDYAKAGQSGASIALTGLAMTGVGAPVAAAGGLLLVLQDIAQDVYLGRQQRRFDREACERSLALYEQATDILNDELPIYQKCCQ